MNENCCLSKCFTELYFFYSLLEVSLAPLIAWPRFLALANFMFCLPLTLLLSHQSFKELWHASAHVRNLEFRSGEPFFQDWLLVKKNPLPLTLRCARKLLYQYSRANWSILEVLNAVFYSFVQALSSKFEVIEEKCTRTYYLICCQCSYK